jgi:prepilin-type N-terminal cleavage/methylation domain-containing protein
MRTGSNRGFTLLEVVLAAAILGASLAAVAVIYLRAVRASGRTRDVNAAVAAARNAVEEGMAGIVSTDESDDGSASAPLVDRAGLSLVYSQPLAGDTEELPLTDDISAEVVGPEGSVFRLAAKRALYTRTIDVDGVDEGGEE